jgi:hypothetical protein
MMRSLIHPFIHSLAMSLRTLCCAHLWTPYEPWYASFLDLLSPRLGRHTITITSTYTYTYTYTYAHLLSQSFNALPTLRKNSVPSMPLQALNPNPPTLLHQQTGVKHAGADDITKSLHAGGLIHAASLVPLAALLLVLWPLTSRVSRQVGDGRAIRSLRVLLSLLVPSSLGVWYWVTWWGGGVQEVWAARAVFIAGLSCTQHVHSLLSLLSSPLFSSLLSSPLLSCFLLSSPLPLPLVFSCLVSHPQSHPCTPSSATHSSPPSPSHIHSASSPLLTRAHLTPLAQALCVH